MTTNSDGTLRPAGIDLLGETDPREVSEFPKTALGLEQSLVLTFAEQ